MRKSDLIRLSETHFGKHSAEITTGKSKHRRTAVVLRTPALEALLVRIPRGRATTILTNTEGQPWTLSGFNSAFRRAMTKAWPEGRDLHLHDLRGTAATNYYRAGFSIREIAEAMAWSEDQVEGLINRYVKRDEILLDRIRRLERFQN